MRRKNAAGRKGRSRVASRKALGARRRRVLEDRGGNLRDDAEAWPDERGRDRRRLRRGQDRITRGVFPAAGGELGGGTFVIAAIALVQPMVQLRRGGKSDSESDAAEKHSGDRGAESAGFDAAETTPHES